MNGYAWAAIGLITLEIIIQVARVGKPRKTPTGGDAAGAVFEWLLLGFLIVMAATA